jgi:hypothetical protein
MNIYSKRGEKVFFTGIGGHPYQLEEAKKIFSVGQELTVDDIDVGSCSSSVKFKEHDEWFNTVMFENTETVVMNNRIEELAKKMDFDCDEDKMFWDQDGLNDGVDLEKFAQMIIQECCNVIDDGNGAASSISENAWRQQCIREIKKHFEVK